MEMKRKLDEKYWTEIERVKEMSKEYYKTKQAAAYFENINNNEQNQ